MPYTQTEYLAGFLAVACLVLLYCCNQKSKEVEGLTRKQSLPGLHFRDGLGSGRFNAVHLPGLRAKTGYFRSGLEGLDAEPAPESLNDAAHVGNLATLNTGVAPGVTQMVEARWNVDSNIAIPLRAATDEDVDRDMLEWGGELPGVDAKALSSCNMAAASLGGVLLTKTDYSPEYGAARGSVTY